MTGEQRERQIESYGRAYDQLVAALAAWPRAMWHYHAPTDPWTIHEIVLHIADSEANSYVRARRAIAEPGSGVMGYDEMGWARALNYSGQDADEALALFRLLRGNTYRLVRTLPAAVWQQTIAHSENGTMTLDDWLDQYEKHVPEHVAQMQAIHQAWQAAGSPAGHAAR